MKVALMKRNIIIFFSFPFFPFLTGITPGFGGIVLVLKCFLFKIGQMKILTCWWRYMKSEGIIHTPEGNLHKMSRQSIQQLSRYLLQSQKCRPHGGTKRKFSGSPKSLGFILWGPWTSVQNLILILPIFVEIFESGTKVVEWLTDWHCKTF